MTSRCSSSLSAGECRSPAIAGEADQLRDRMSHSSRRDVFKAALAGASATAFLGRSVPAAPAEPAEGAPAPGRGVEGQRKADLGDGTFLNPIVAGDHPDPTVLKDGDDYYMTFSSFFSYPGAVIWHSRDLVNWAAVGPALRKPLGSVWAMDLVNHKGRYYIYIPANPTAPVPSSSFTPTLSAAPGVSRSI